MKEQTLMINENKLFPDTSI